MSNLKPGVQQIMTCTSETCATHGTGHAISVIRERAANATPSKWRDAFVAHVDADGWIALDLFSTDLVETDGRIWAWHHDDLTASVSIGQPVALHAVYDVLSIGSQRLSVLVAAAA